MVWQTVLRCDAPGPAIATMNLASVRVASCRVRVRGVDSQSSVALCVVAVVSVLSQAMMRDAAFEIAHIVAAAVAIESELAQVTQRVVVLMCARARPHAEASAADSAADSH